MSDNIFPADKVVQSDYGKQDNADFAPRWAADVECVSPNGDKWTDKWANSVMQGGKVDIVARYFGAASSASAGSQSVWYIFPHSLTTVTATSYSISNFTGGSEVTGYTTGNGFTAGSRIGISLASANATTNYMTTGISMAWNGNTLSGPWTVAGLGVMNYAGNVQTANGGVLYSVGNFNAGSRQVQAGDTLNVSLTLSMQ